MASRAAMVIDEAFIRLPNNDCEVDGALITVGRDGVEIRELHDLDEGVHLMFGRAEWEAIAAMVDAEYVRMGAQEKLNQARAAANEQTQLERAIKQEVIALREETK